MLTVLQNTEPLSSYGHGGGVMTTSPFSAMRRLKIHILVYAAMSMLTAYLVVYDIWSILRLWLDR
jgi:hypothetical protein